MASFVHRTSREGDPQLHTHCLVPNVVRRRPDGRHVALAARPLFVWARAAGSIYQAELQRSLAVRLGVEWGPDRSNTRDLDGFTSSQLRAFSKRTVRIEAELEARGAAYESAALRMQADDEASLATRPAKDHTPPRPCSPAAGTPKPPPSASTWVQRWIAGCAGATRPCRSRARYPTHTWITTALEHPDHGGRLADQRTPAEQVAAGLARMPDATMAAVDDPRPTDRRLRAAIDAHRSVLDHSTNRNQPSGPSPTSFGPPSVPCRPQASRTFASAS